MYLLDTNALVYMLCSPKSLSKQATDILLSEKNIYVSVVSFWEIAIKQFIGKLNISSTIEEIESLCTERNISILPIKSVEIEGPKKLPAIHKDPFDRLIISQAQINKLAIITSDTTIPKYNVKTIPAL